MFAGCEVNVTMDGRRHIGAAIVTRPVRAREGRLLGVLCPKVGKIARVQPHVAYCAFTHDLIGKWTHFLHTIPDV